MTEKEQIELQELINLLYNNHLSQYGKRKLEGYIKKLQVDIEIKDKVIDLAIKMIDNYENQLNISNFKNKKEIKEFLFKKVEEEKC